MMLWTEDDYGIIADKACWTLFGIFFSQGRLGRLGLDDYITALCVIVNLITCIFITIGSSYGLGRRQATLTNHEFVNAVKWNVYTSGILIHTFSLPKFAIIALLKRILDYGTKTAILFWTLAGICQITLVAASVWWFRQCTPVAYQWDRTIPGGKCHSVQIMSNLGYSTSALSAFLDLFFAFYPIPFIMKLNMPLKNRIAVSCALSLSSLAFIISIYKLTIFRSVFNELAKDLTYPVPYLNILGIAEAAILLICASLPTLGPLFRLAKGKITSIASRNSKNHSGVIDSQGRRAGTIVTIGQWSTRHHKLKDPENISTTGVHSVDDIPLVTTSTRVSHYQEQSKEDVGITSKPMGYSETV
ncbi:hypothetical protein PT974_00089 [Cladobotryum mycophilum]|uniref:Rhodopsin domain-containing protein n=1 Tax=Cladobotryum mycophilum TaxID=491253 RepID=A0ABR0T051_9HYPO